MNFLLLIGSLRADSYNRKVAEAYIKLAGARAKFIEGDFSKFPLYNEEIQAQGFPVEVTALADQIRTSDAVLIVSPEYNYSVPGALKNALDWVSRLKDQPFAGKACSVIGASVGGIGTARMQYHLRQIGVFLDMQFMTKPEIMVGKVQGLIDESGKLSDAVTLEFLRKHFDAFEKFAARTNQPSGDRTEPARPSDSRSASE